VGASASIRSAVWAPAIRARAALGVHRPDRQQA
jgi:hypothetical protein